MNRTINKFIRNAISVAGGGLSQRQNDWEKTDYLIPTSAKDSIRRLAAEGIVMLKNNGVLPLKNKEITVFGRSQIDYFYCGYGSGGDVNPPYKINLIDALKKCKEITLNDDVLSFYKDYILSNPADDGFWGHWPMHYNEPMPSDLLIHSAVSKTDTAIIVIGRAAGEDRENILKKGSYFLTDRELKLLDKVTSCFKNTIVIYDCGNIIDMQALEKYGDKISAILYAFQGGMESGNALADILTGKVNPSGKLCDTIAYEYEDYPSSENFGNKNYNNYSEDIYVGYRYFETFAPDRVLYPFGYGLSYTSFSYDIIYFNTLDNNIYIKINVKNTGSCKGKEVIQLYCEQPCNTLPTAKRILCDFKKTNLLFPNESQELEFAVPLYSISSFDDTGVTGYEASYIIQQGTYRFYVSTSVRNGTLAGEFNCKKTECIQKLKHICFVKYPFERITNENGSINYEKVLPVKCNLKERITQSLPSTIELSADKGYKLSDVKIDRVSIEDFISQLSIEELKALTHGDYTMNSSLGANGNAGAFAGITQSLRDKGIPPIIATDGPAGIRLRCKCSLLPTGICAASSWNTKLIKEVYTFISNEMNECGSDLLLAPGMNIHRDPLCGRNFEYFSEDPVLSGMCASAVVEGIQSGNLGACPKHFACNNQETNRINNDSRVSERALREIYLKGFEIAVKRAGPRCIMTSYNKINGVYSYHNYDLVTTVLRDEWKYDGLVITDWWTKNAKSPDFPKVEGNAYRIRAQVDVLMPGADSRLPLKCKKSNNTITKSLASGEGLTIGEIQRSAKNVLNFCLTYNKKGL